MASEPTFNVTDHLLVPKHELVDEKERQQIFEHHNAQQEDFPKILITDPGLTGLSVSEGDLIKISRNSTTAGAAVFYRIVVSE